jgi:hypothetical protein
MSSWGTHGMVMVYGDTGRGLTCYISMHISMHISMLRGAWFSSTKLRARCPEKVVGLGCAG